MKTYSIKTRLTLYYALTTSIILIGISLLFYSTTLHILHKANQLFLSDEITTLSHLLEDHPNNLPALKREVLETPYTETQSGYHYFIRILDEQNHTMLETPNDNNAFKHADFFEQPDKKMIHWHSNKSRFVLMQAKSNLGANRQALIQVVLDITYQHSIVNGLGKLLILILFIALLIAVWLGYVIAKRAMHSLYRLTETTQQITVNSLHQRIDPQFWPRELQRLGLSFNAMLERIENAVTHLTQFSGDLAHELRTPINNLMGETEIALFHDHTIQEYREVLESHLEELQRLSEIIENILFLARTENPILDLKREWIHVADEIVFIHEFYQAMADEKKIQMTITGDSVLHVNVTLFHRMLSNLLSNALKYTSEGGAIQFTVEQKAHAVQITLTDTGIGIAREHLPYLFDRFYRVDSARARSVGGVGLGLSIVKSIVELHHGSITVTSIVNKGTTFSLLFPIE